MHVPDGFLDVPTSVATGAVAAGAVGVALRKAGPEIRESGPALPGLVAAFIFATQMVNFPVGAGTSGHLLGGALAAALVGPWTGILCMTVVLVVQAVLFADGGLTALGTNVVLMGVVTVAVGYLVIRALLAVLPASRSSVVGASVLGAFVAVPVAAVVFSLLYAVGGTVDLPIGKVATAMIGWHLLIGLGEAMITGAVVGAVLSSRPDIVYVARHLAAELELVGPDGERTLVSADSAAPARRGHRGTLLGLVGASVVVAGGISYLASASPDGLEFVGEQLGFAGEDSAVAGSPLADYAVSGVGNTFWSGSLAGLLGVAVTILVGVALAWLLRRRRSSPDPETPQPDSRSQPAVR